MEFIRGNTFKETSVLVRVDFNVPINEETGQVDDDFRLRQALPTLKELLHGHNKLILLAHLGRPEGKWDKKLTLRPVAMRLAELMDVPFADVKKGAWPEAGRGHEVVFFDGDIRQETSRKKIKEASAKQIVVLENMRFYPGEDACDPLFTKQLSELGEAYVNEAFSVDHRKAASVSEIARRLPAFGGLMLEKEITSLGRLLKKSNHPFVVLMGGIKISDKARTLEHLGSRADKILLGGGLANLIFKSKGLEIGKSKIEDGAEKLAWEIEKNFKDRLILPPDLVVANEKMEPSTIRVTTPYDVKKDELILDCGPKTILEFSHAIKSAKTIVWNGPLGHFEVKPFHTATIALARLLGGRGLGHAYVVAGGGETVDAIRHSHQAGHIDHLSTGGGAMLEFLAGDSLPGIEALG